jgi:hypothetical protein
MWSAELVLVCALSALGRAPSTFPPIALVDVRPPGVSSTAEGFVRPGERRIYLLTNSTTFRDAMASDTKCSNFQAVRKLASVLIHEEFHIKRPGDEPGAYAAQLIALEAMGIGSSHPVYVSVRRSMFAVIERQRQDRMMLARRAP